MGALTDDLTATHLAADWRLWQIEEDMVCRLSVGDLVIVPKGFISDGPSVPPLLWAVLPPWGRCAPAGILHDFLCFLIACGRPHPRAPTRLDADRLFDAAMGALGVNWLPRLALYIGVRIGALLGVKTRMIMYNGRLKGLVDAAADGV